MSEWKIDPSLGPILKGSAPKFILTLVFFFWCIINFFQKGKIVAIINGADTPTLEK